MQIVVIQTIFLSPFFFKTTITMVYKRDLDEIKRVKKRTDIWTT